MANISLTTNSNKSLSVSLPAQDPKSWNTVTSSSIAPNRGDFLMAQFKKDYKSFTEVDTVERLLDLASRNKIISKWLAEKNASFVEDVKVPTYLKQLISTKDFNKAIPELQSFNKINADEAKEIAAKTEAFKKDIAKITEAKEKERKKLRENKILKVLTLKTADLPISLSIQISKYSPLTDGPTVKAYTRELLINYQIALLTWVKNNPEDDIDILINEMAEK